MRPIDPPIKTIATPATRWRLLAEIRRRLSNRPDREHEIALNRLLMCNCCIAYLRFACGLEFDFSTGLSQFTICIVIYNVVMFGHLLWKPGISIGRRLIGMCFDLMSVAIFFHLGDEMTALFYPVFLWAIFGNGFRFGVPYLFAAMGVAVACFGAVVATTPFWRDHLALGCGLLAGLIVLPVYVSALIRQLTEAKRLAEEASKAKTMFLASVSHELRTPLNAIIGLGDLLAGSKLDAEQADMSRTIARSGRSLLSLINSILDTSRMEIGALTVQAHDVDLYAFLVEIRDMLSVQAVAKNIRFALHISTRVPQFVTLNPRHIEEILINLGANAVKFTQDGYVMVVVDAPKLEDGSCRLRFEVSDTGIGISPEARERIFERFTQADETIIDRFGGTGLGLTIAKQLVEGHGGKIGVESVVGVGSIFWFEIDCKVQAREEDSLPPVGALVYSMDPALRDSIVRLDPAARCFSRSDEMEATFEERRRDGVRNIVAILDEDALSGDIRQMAEELHRREAGSNTSIVWIRDAKRGAPPDEIRCLFTTILERPIDDRALGRALRIATARRHVEAAPGLEGGSAAGHPKLSILVAEDNRTNQMVIRKILERAGHAVTMADNGQAAIELMCSGHFDLTFMDINMPVLNGIDAAKLYQFAAPEQDRIPIVALTADASPEMRARCEEASMIDCITKPIEPDELIAWIDAFSLSRGISPDSTSIETLEPEMIEAEEEAVEPLDLKALNNLQSLGGKEFVDEIVDQFLTDAALVLRNLHDAVSASDLQGFRDEAHALRSCAGNVGAQKVYKLCLDWRAINAHDFAVEGEERMRVLELEFDKAREALNRYRVAE